MVLSRRGKVIVSNGRDQTGILKRHLFEIVKILRQLRLPFMVIGAFALPVWGRPRATLDLDFMIQTNEVPETLIRPAGGFCAKPL